jgi:hypothetical protein
MAIKGKGKTKGRQPARAPRRAPVEVTPPFFLRRRVQVALAFVVGILLMLLAIWITNGLRTQNADEKATTQASQQRAAAERWKSQVESSLGTVGTLTPGKSPVVFTDLATAIASLQKGDVPNGAATVLKKAQADAKTAIDPLKAYKLSDQIRDMGMTEGQVSWFLNSQTRFVQSLELYSQAAALAALAIDASKDQRTAIANSASDLQSKASEILQQGWSDYQNALGSVQIFDSPLQSLTGPTGASGAGS